MELQTLIYLRSFLDKQTKKLEDLREEHGDKISYQKPSHIFFKKKQKTKNIHLLLLEQIKDKAKDFQIERKEQKSERKKLAKLVEKSLKEIKERAKRKKKEEKKKRELKAKMISGMVFKDFWKGCHKIVKFRRDSEFKAQKKRENKKRVDDFLKMQSRLADEILKEIKLTHAHRKAGGGLGVHLQDSDKVRTRIEEFDGWSMLPCNC
jgi:hypothetical protein